MVTLARDVYIRPCPCKLWLEYVLWSIMITQTNLMYIDINNVFVSWTWNNIFVRYRRSINYFSAELETESTAVLLRTGLPPRAWEDSCWPGQQFFLLLKSLIWGYRHVGIHRKGIFMRNLNLESSLWLARLLSRLALKELTWITNWPKSPTLLMSLCAHCQVIHGQTQTVSDLYKT